VAYERSDFTRIDEAMQLVLDGLPLKPDSPA
jgi:hypothetical protein